MIFKILKKIPDGDMPIGRIYTNKSNNQRRFVCKIGEEEFVLYIGGEYKKYLADLAKKQYIQIL